MISTYFRKNRYYSALYAITAGSILLVLLGNQGCRTDSSKQSASSTDKKALVGRPATDKPKTVRPTSNLPPPSKKVVVRLIEPGKKPLKKARYKFEAGNRNATRVTVNEKLSVNANGKKRPKTVSPPVNFELTASVDEAPKRGVAKLKLVFGRSSISNASPKAHSKIIADMLGTLDGVPGIQSVADNGTVESTNIEFPESASSGVRKLWQGTQRIAQNLVRFPEEEIGVGAQWEVIQDVELATSTRQTTKYELVALDRRGGIVKAEISQIGRPGLVPEMSNDDIETYLDVYKATGKGRLEFKFNSGVSIGKVTTTADAMYTSESDTEDNTTEYHTIQTVEIDPITPGKKSKK